MKNASFTNHGFLFQLSLYLLIGALLGYWRETQAASGNFVPRDIFVSSIIGAIAFGTAFSAINAITRLRGSIMGHIITSIIGSVLLYTLVQVLKDSIQPLIYQDDLSINSVGREIGSIVFLQGFVGRFALAVFIYFVLSSSFFWITQAIIFLLGGIAKSVRTR